MASTGRWPRWPCNRRFEFAVLSSCVSIASQSHYVASAAPQTNTVDHDIKSPKLIAFLFFCLLFTLLCCVCFVFFLSFRSHSFSFHFSSHHFGFPFRIVFGQAASPSREAPPAPSPAVELEANASSTFAASSTAAPAQHQVRAALPLPAQLAPLAPASATAVAPVASIAAAGASGLSDVVALAEINANLLRELKGHPQLYLATLQAMVQAQTMRLLIQRSPEEAAKLMRQQQQQQQQQQPAKVAFQVNSNVPLF